jgi:hypothetical protein
MCDFSLHAVRSRPAKVGDKLTTRLFNTGTRGFRAPEDEGMAVCLLPGTELSFAGEVKRSSPWPWTERVIGCKTAIIGIRVICRRLPRLRERRHVLRLLGARGLPDLSGELIRT